MLAKGNRVQRGEDFRRIVRSGRRAGCAIAVVYSAPANTADARFGFIVSKQVGGAVVRNRVKRRLSAIVRARLPLDEPRDVVIRALPGAATADFATLAAGIDPLLGAR